MNVSNFGRVLGDFGAMLDVRFRNAADHDSIEHRVALYDPPPMGLPGPDALETHGRGAVDGRLMVSLQHSRGSGALIDTFVREVERTAKGVFELHALQRLVRRFDFALFALDHDGGHGVEVERGVRELWLASGSDTWSAYAAKRAEVLKWCETAPNGSEAP